MHTYFFGVLSIQIPSTLIFGYFSVHINVSSSFHCNSTFNLASGQLLSRTLARLPARPPENNEVVYLFVCLSVGHKHDDIDDDGGGGGEINQRGQEIQSRTAAPV